MYILIDSCNTIILVWLRDTIKWPHKSSFKLLSNSSWFLFMINNSKDRPTLKRWHHQHFFWFLYYTCIKQIDSMLLCICSVIDHTRHDKMWQEHQWHTRLSHCVSLFCSYHILVWSITEQMYSNYILTPVKQPTSGKWIVST